MLLKAWGWLGSCTARPSFPALPCLSTSATPKLRFVSKTLTVILSDPLAGFRLGLWSFSCTVQRICDTFSIACLPSFRRPGQFFTIDIDDLGKIAWRRVLIGINGHLDCKWCLSRWPKVDEIGNTIILFSGTELQAHCRHQPHLIRQYTYLCCQLLQQLCCLF